MRWVRRDGTARHIHATSSAVVFENEAAHLVVARDMTEQVRREQQRATSESAVRESERRYRLLFDGSPLPISLFDAETFRFVAVNDKMVELYGYSRDEFLSTIPSLVSVVATARTGGLRRVGVTRHYRKDGTAVIQKTRAEERP